MHPTAIGGRTDPKPCEIRKKMSAIPTEPRKPAPPSVADDPRWARIVARDKTADGNLWYSVSTTGVYCRPSCPSRIANPKNVQLHGTLESAKATGFRPCKRCNPDGPSIEYENAALVAKVCRVIEESEEEPSLQELADAIGRSPSYFHHIFTAATGVTPKQYAAAHRARKVRQGLAAGDSVTEAIYGAGFNSSGRFYEKSMDMFPNRIAATPFLLEATRMAPREVCPTANFISSFVPPARYCDGVMPSDPEELVRNLQDRFPKARLVGADQDYEALVARVVAFVEKPGIGLSLPLDVRGTAFQQRVCRALQEIPVGETVSYAEIAQRIGHPKAVRAVTGACAENNLAVAMPCHRVVPHRRLALRICVGRVERKRALLDREGFRETRNALRLSARTLTLSLTWLYAVYTATQGAAPG